MATFTITTEGRTNNPPYQIGRDVISLQDNSNDYIFTVDNFTTYLEPEYADPEGDDLAKIKILSLPSEGNGQLLLNNNNIIVGDEIQVNDINQGLLIYKPMISTNPYSEFFTFDVADDGSNQYGGLTGRITFYVFATENEPPIIGDNSKDRDYGEALVFTPAMFTSETTPPYTDPESDNPAYLRIIDLPSSGLIKLNGNNISTYQEIPFSDIANNYLVYYPDNTLTTETTVNFIFQVKDSGSGQYSN